GLLERLVEAVAREAVAVDPAVDVAAVHREQVRRFREGHLLTARAHRLAREQRDRVVDARGHGAAGLGVELVGVAVAGAVVLHGVPLHVCARAPLASQRLRDRLDPGLDPALLRHRGAGARVDVVARVAVRRGIGAGRRRRPAGVEYDEYVAAIVPDAPRARIARTRGNGWTSA